MKMIRYWLFSIVSVVRNKAIEQMCDGMLVLDADDRIADLNRAAQEIFGVTRSTIGHDAALVLGSCPDLLKLISDRKSTHGEVKFGSIEPRCYRVNVSPVVDRKGVRHGQILIFDDITDSQKVQKRLIDQQRKLATLEERERLARELHDGIGQILAAAHLQAEAASEFLARGDVPSVGTCLNHLVRVTQEAKKSIREYLLDVKRDIDMEQNFFSGLRQYIEHYGGKYGIHTDLVAPAELEEKGFEHKVEVELQAIIIEALRNVRKHAGARSARICFECNDGQAQVTIEDDGRGFSASDLQGSEGFGLRSMRGRAESVGVQFDVNASLGKGTKVFLQVPWQKDQPARVKS